MCLLTGWYWFWVEKEVPVIMLPDFASSAVLPFLSWLTVASDLLLSESVVLINLLLRHLGLNSSSLDSSDDVIIEDTADNEDDKTLFRFILFRSADACKKYMGTLCFEYVLMYGAKIEAIT